MIIQVNEICHVARHIKDVLDESKIENELIMNKSNLKWNTGINYKNPIHHHFLWSWNMPSSILRAKKLIVHAHGSDSDIYKKRYYIPATLLNLRKPLCLFSMACQLNRLKWYKGRKKHFPIPVDTDKIFPVNTKKYPLNRILCWTQLRKVKGVDTIFEIAKLRPDIQFDIPDFSFDKNYYHSIAPPNINFIEKIPFEKIHETISKYQLAICDFTKWGSFGTAPLETLACNVPTIQYVHEENKNFYDDFPPFMNFKEPKEIAKMIDEPIKNNTRKWVIKYHGMQATKKRLLEIYEEEGFI